MTMPQNQNDPRNGESMVDWINRNRPSMAPDVEGVPNFGPDGLGWLMEGWIITISVSETGRPVCHWAVPDGHIVVGYSIEMNGARTTFINVENGDPVNVMGWPVAA